MDEMSTQEILDLLSKPPNPFDRMFISPASENLQDGLVRFYTPWPGERLKVYYDMEKEENVNYLFVVWVIDLKAQSLLGSIPVICCDVPRAVAITTLRLELSEDILGHVKFHVERVCVVPEWEG